MRIGLGNDHGGYPLRAAVAEVVRQLGHELVDFGSDSPEPTDYPDIAVAVARAVAGGEVDLAVLLCGTGIGISIAANKVPGAYAAACSDWFSAKMSREHNAANILCLGARVIGPGAAEELARIFLTTAPSHDERHVRRQRKTAAIRPASK